VIRKHYTIIIMILIVVVAGVIAVSITQISSNSNNNNANASNVVRIGFFANITHAPALVAKANSIFEQELKGYKVEYKVFKAGPDASLALLTNNVDFVYIGPVPAINAYAVSNGNVRVIAGAAANGAMFIVNDKINSIADLHGKTFGTPQYGNTQDIALKSYLRDNGLALKDEQGDVSIINANNSELFILFKNGYIQGAWVPEPWATRMLNEGGKVFIDEKDLWEGNRFVTTVLLTRLDIINERPELVKKMLKAHISAVDWMNANMDKAIEVVIDEIKGLTGQSLSKELIKDALKNVEFTYDPMVYSIQGYYNKGKRLGLMQDIDISDMVYTKPLESIITK